MCETVINRIVDTIVHLPNPSGTLIVGVTGSVAIGKTTFSSELEKKLLQKPDFRAVLTLSTDGFLYPAEVLRERHLMHKKGFPESYDQEKLLAFFEQVRSGQQPLKVNLYSHEIYDILPGIQSFNLPDILILEGLNLLEYTDYLDFTIFIDAPIPLIKTWFLQRYENLLQAAVYDKTSFFHPFTQMPKAQALQRALDVWEKINEPNLIQHILPLKHRADLIIYKGEGHRYCFTPENQP